MRVLALQHLETKFIKVRQAARMLARSLVLPLRQACT